MRLVLDGIWNLGVGEEKGRAAERNGRGASRLAGRDKNILFHDG